ncbi:hypothetical protein ACR6HW_04595 [Fusibacter sp. JL298sf-3]
MKKNIFRYKINDIVMTFRQEDDKYLTVLPYSLSVLCFNKIQGEIIYKKMVEKKQTECIVKELFASSSDKAILEVESFLSKCKKHNIL